MRRRWHPLFIGIVAAIGALLAGTAVVLAFDDDGPSRPEPEVELSFGEDDDESGVDDLIGGAVDGEPAPDASFALLEGGTMRLADLEGTPVVVNFFYKDCPPCVGEMPAIEAVHQELGDRVHFLGVSFRESVDSAREIVEQTGVTYQIARDPSGELFLQFEGLSLPSTYFIGADGTVVDSKAGAMDAGELRERVEALL